MKLTIIPSDGSVYLDNWSFNGLDLSFIPSNIHALQWKNDLGWIEFVEDNNFIKPPNEVIKELPAWANAAVSKWKEAQEQFENLQKISTNQPTSTGSQTL